MTTENQPFEDASPIKNCVFSNVMLVFRGCIYCEYEHQPKNPKMNAFWEGKVFIPLLSFVYFCQHLIWYLIRILKEHSFRAKWWCPPFYWMLFDAELVWDGGKKPWSKYWFQGPWGLQSNCSGERLTKTRSQGSKRISSGWIRSKGYRLLRKCDVIKFKKHWKVLFLAWSFCFNLCFACWVLMILFCSTMMIMLPTAVM